MLSNIDVIGFKNGIGIIKRDCKIYC